MIKYRGLEELVFGPTHEGDAKIAYDGVHYTMRTPAGKGLGLSFSAAPVAYGGAQSFIEIGGDTDSPLELAIDDYWFAIRSSIENANNPATQKMFAFARFWYQQSTEHQANLDVCGLQSVLNISKNTGWCKNIDAYTDIKNAVSMKGGASILAVVNAQLMNTGIATCNAGAVGFFGVNGAAAPAAGGRDAVLFAMIYNTASMTAGLRIDTDDSGSLTDLISIPGGGAITNVLNFAETDGSTGAKTGATIANDKAADGCLKIKVGSTVYYIPYFVADDVSGSW